MTGVSEEFKKEIQDILDRERWQGYVAGKIEGALNVLYALDLTKDERLELLSEACGLTESTAEGFLEPREIEYRIYNKKNIAKEERDALFDLMSNDAMKDDTVLGQPDATLKLLASFADDTILETCLPQIDIWIKNGEKISLNRVREWIIKKYDLF